MFLLAVYSKNGVIIFCVSENDKLNQWFGAAPRVGGGEKADEALEAAEGMGVL